MTSEHEVHDAAAHLVTVFGRHDPAAYFACFAPDATFVFHNHPEILTSRAAYEEVWAGWEADGFHVEGCESVDGAVTCPSDDLGVFTHRVRTRLAGEPEVQEERESIVFCRQADGSWLAVHEHLSPDPGPGPA